MTPQNVFRKPGVFLVQVGDRYALVDATGQQIVLLNQSGAWLWSQLGRECGPPARPFAGFLDELHELDLLGMTNSEPCTETPARTDEAPQVLGIAPLQVAANNSGDPFAGTGW